MEVVITEDVDAVAGRAADIVVALLRSRPGAVLGVATGSTPLPTYLELGRRVAAGEVSFERCRAFLLDEYIGLPPDHPECYANVVRRRFADVVGLPPHHVAGPDVWAPDLSAACAAYEDAIVSAGGIDLQLLGIGADGHIGFNEPGSSLASLTRPTTLTSVTRGANAHRFGSIDDVPRHAVTQGVATIGRARHVLLLATGAHKSSIVAAAVEGPITAMVPASALQLHPHVTVVVDEAAASRLSLADYYREIEAAGPAWRPA